MPLPPWGYLRRSTLTAYGQGRESDRGPQRRPVLPPPDRRTDRRAARRRALGKCLDISNGATWNSALVQIYDCNGTGAQQWRPRADGSIVNPQSGRCLDVPGGTTRNGWQLIIWDCHGGANQRWRLAP
ncbi:ricin-type beta-trefoil lectin domain protein [Kitasatospora sp. NPDC001574]